MRQPEIIIHEEFEALDQTPQRMSILQAENNDTLKIDQLYKDKMISKKVLKVHATSKLKFNKQATKRLNLHIEEVA